MPKLLQINITANWGSTGKIAEQIGLCAMAHGWESYVAYGRWMKPSESNVIRIGSMADTYLHYGQQKFFDNEGLNSRLATKRFIKEIERIKPDVIHLHNIHDHYMNYPLLFEYLSTLDIPIVWTQHDCWAFTGGCMYFDLLGCDRWKNACGDCPDKRALLYNMAKGQHAKKRECFGRVKNLTLVPVSAWLEGVLKESFFGNKRIVPIFNGVDVDVFRPVDGTKVRDKYGIDNKPMLLGVANVWAPRKGLSDYLELARQLGDDYRMVLLGLNEKQMQDLPQNVVGIKRTENVEEMAALYSGADIVLNLSYEETFGLTTVEGFACGTPSIVYNKTASPELITSDTGFVVEARDFEAIKAAVREILNNGKARYSDACRKRAEECYDKNKCFEKYVRLYESLV